MAGWMQYYGRFRRSGLDPLLTCINAYLVRWIRKKYERLRAKRKAIAKRGRSPSGTPACSRTGPGPPPRPGDQGGRSRVTRDRSARSSESRGVRFPSATRRLKSSCRGSGFD
ncbi:group II intron maturase-specific domain-containing protein [Streptomyces sp. NPDC002659]|uniref:group II intron maturase-specific domain-containing protein n=1 Tax=Streptomyces sp. NPDC002659 TaxID=3364656 RepID=UPI0036B25DDA